MKEERRVEKKRALKREFDVGRVAAGEKDHAAVAEYGPDIARSPRSKLRHRLFCGERGIGLKKNECAVHVLTVKGRTDGIFREFKELPDRLQSHHGDHFEGACKRIEIRWRRMREGYAREAR